MVLAPAPARNDHRPSAVVSPALQKLGISVLAVLITALALWVALRALDTPVRSLAISGLGHNVSAQDVRAAAVPTLGKRLMQLNLEAVRQAVAAIPWIASARVNWVWPGKVLIAVQERQVFAAWGEHDALAIDGAVFDPGNAKIPKDLPRLSGPAGRELEVMNTYRDLSDRLADTPFVPVALALDARGDWTSTQANGTQIRFGRDNPLEKVQRLKQAVLPNLSSRLSQVRRIDLRYANGFAVAWRDPAVEHTAPAPAAPRPQP